MHTQRNPDAHAKEPDAHAKEPRCTRKGTQMHMQRNPEAHAKEPRSTRKVTQMHTQNKDAHSKEPRRTRKGTRSTRKGTRSTCKGTQMHTPKQRALSQSHPPRPLTIHPTLRGRPVVVPYSLPISRRLSAGAPNTSVG